VPAAALVAAAVVGARSKTGVLTSAPLAGPLGYGNANAAFYVQAAIAGLMLASTARPWLLRLIGGVGAGIFVFLPFVAHAVTAAWLVVVLPAIALVASYAGARGVRVSIAIFAVGFGAVLVGTILAGAGYSPTSAPNLFERAAIQAADRDRVILWHDAFMIMQEHPVGGVGPGRYQVISPIASKDRDYRWAHNEFLQQGAEGGVLGLVVLALIFLWGFARLWVAKGPGPITALSGAALAALGIHASTDYIIHFPAIPLLAAGLVAIGMIDMADRGSPLEAARQPSGGRP
jgi:O-antigen ligase